jgi:hypothetical protein
MFQEILHNMAVKHDAANAARLMAVVRRLERWKC